MDRKFLEELGLEKETIDKVMAEYGKSINSYKEKIQELEGLSEKVKGYEQQLNDLQNTLATQDEHLKTNIAIQAGIPLELAGRLSGESEEEIKADAEKLAGLIGKQKPTLPLKPTEPEKVDEKEQAYAKLLNNLD